MATKEPRLGIALVGLGSYSEKELAPALQHTKYCYLAGAVTGTPDKRKRWQKQFNLPETNIFSYEEFDRIADNDEIKIVYVVTPPARHAEFVVRAARAGKHVICEKPMATTIDDCQQMINACREAGKQLSLGYRLHFDPYNLELMRLGQDRTYGKIVRVDACNGSRLASSDVWRAKKALAGGGPLMDLGIYCVQGAIYVLGEEPVSVSAEFEHHGTLTEVEDGIRWTMTFASGAIADCRSSYVEEFNFLKAGAERGLFGLEPAYQYRGLTGFNREGPLQFLAVNQQANQMDHFARCIVDGRASPVPGEMGLRDIRIIKAIYDAADTGRAVVLTPMGVLDKQAPHEVERRLHC